MYNVDELPFGGEFQIPERIVCSANRYEYDDGTFELFIGMRHSDEYMANQMSNFEKLTGFDLDDLNETQGFLTSKRRFVDRFEAWKIALEQKQIVRRVGGDSMNGGKLFSENMY